MAEVLDLITAVREEALTLSAGGSSKNMIIEKENGLVKAWVSNLDTERCASEAMRRKDSTKPRGLGNFVVVTLTNFPYPNIINGNPAKPNNRYKPDPVQTPSALQFFVPPQVPYLYFFNNSVGQRIVAGLAQAAQGAKTQANQTNKDSRALLAQAATDAGTTGAEFEASKQSIINQMVMKQNEIYARYNQEVAELTAQGSSLSADLAIRQGSDIRPIQVNVSRQEAKLTFPARATVFNTETPVYGDLPMPYEGQTAEIFARPSYADWIKWTDPRFELLDLDKVTPNADEDFSRKVTITTPLTEEDIVRAWLDVMEGYLRFRIDKVTAVAGAAANKDPIVEKKRLSLEYDLALLRDAKRNGGVIGRHQTAKTYLELSKELGIEIKQFFPFNGTDVEAMEDMLVRYQRFHHGLPRDLSWLENWVYKMAQDKSRSIVNRRFLLSTQLRHHILDEIKEFCTAKSMRRIQEAHKNHLMFARAHPEIPLDELSSRHRREMDTIREETIKAIVVAKEEMEAAVEKELDVLMERVGRGQRLGEADGQAVVKKIIDKSNFDDTEQAKIQFQRFLNQIKINGATAIEKSNHREELSEKEKKIVTLMRRIDFATFNDFDKVDPIIPQYFWVIYYLNLSYHESQVKAIQADSRDLEKRYIKDTREQNGRGPLGLAIGVNRSSLENAQANLRSKQRGLEKAKVEKRQRILGLTSPPSRYGNRNGKGRGGAWSINPIYWRFAFIETPLVFALASWAVQGALNLGSDVLFAGSLWFLAPVLFKLGHQIDNPDYLASKDYHFLFRGKILISALGWAWTVTNADFLLLVLTAAILVLTVRHAWVQWTTAPGKATEKKAVEFEESLVENPAKVGEVLEEARELASNLPESPAITDKDLKGPKWEFVRAFLNSTSENPEAVTHVIDLASSENLKDDLRDLLSTIHAVNSMRARRGDKIKETMYVILETDPDRYSQIELELNNSGLPEIVSKFVKAKLIPSHVVDLPVLIKILSEHEAEPGIAPDQKINMLLSGDLYDSAVSQQLPDAWRKVVFINRLDWGEGGQFDLARLLISFYFPSAEENWLKGILAQFGSVLTFQNEVNELVKRMA